MERFPIRDKFTVLTMGQSEGDIYHDYISVTNDAIPNTKTFSQSSRRGLFAFFVEMRCAAK